MSFATLEKAILTSAQRLLNNPTLKKNDLIEWSSGQLQPEAGEVTVYVEDPGVWVTVKQDCDKRTK